MYRTLRVLHKGNEFENFVVYSSVQNQMHLLNVIKNAFALVLNLSVLMYFEFNVLLIYTDSPRQGLAIQRKTYD